MQFADSARQVNEARGTLSARIVRSGDLSISSAVRCYTRQASAQVMMDYEERPNTDASLVRFEPGKRCSLCVNQRRSVTKCVRVLVYFLLTSKLQYILLCFRQVIRNLFDLAKR